MDRIIANSLSFCVTQWFQLFGLYQDICTLQFPHGPAAIVAGNAINGAMTVFASNVGKPPLHWLQSLVLVVISTFGGGIIAPLSIARPMMVSVNDLIIPFCIISWYSVHYLGLQPFLNQKHVKVIWSMLLGLFRTHSQCNIVTHAANSLAPGMYYPCPLVGPILAGTLLGSMGQFLPFDKGLNPLKSGTPWVIEASFLTSVFYYFMICDTKGFIGHAVRRVLGEWTQTEVICVIATGHMASVATLAIHPATENIFNPIHDILYSLFGVAKIEFPQTNDPESHKRKIKEQPNKVWYDVWILCIMVIFTLKGFSAIISPCEIQSVSLMHIGEFPSCLNSSLLSEESCSRVSLGSIPPIVSISLEKLDELTSGNTLALFTDRANISNSRSELSVCRLFPSFYNCSSFSLQFQWNSQNANDHGIGGPVRLSVTKQEHSFFPLERHSGRSGGVEIWKLDFSVDTLEDYDSLALLLTSSGRIIIVGLPKYNATDGGPTAIEEAMIPRGPIAAPNIPLPAEGGRRNKAARIKQKAFASRTHFPHEHPMPVQFWKFNKVLYVGDALCRTSSDNHDENSLLTAHLFLDGVAGTPKVRCGDGTIAAL